MIPFEEDNLRAYVLLLRIEIVLRECLRQSMESEFGPYWQKRLPGDLRKIIKESQDAEHKPQFNFLRLGPLYYLTFGELLGLLQRAEGRSVAERLGGGCFLKQLENLLAPRNALCHSRPVSSVGLKTVETLYAQMETALTEEVLAQLMADPDIGLSQEEAVKAIKPLLEQALHELPDLPRAFPIPKAYELAERQFWWADDSLATFSCSCVESAIALIREYNAIPIGVGSAGNRQKFCDQRGMKKQIQDAIIELGKVAL